MAAACGEQVTGGGAGGLGRLQAAAELVAIVTKYLEFEFGEFERNLLLLVTGESHRLPAGK